MNPDDIRPWMPLVRDVAALVVGMGVGVYGVVKNQPGFATAGFGIAGWGAWGRATKAPETT